MVKATILALSTVVPEFRHDQMELHDRWLSLYIKSNRARAIFTAAEIETRHSVLPTSAFLADQPGTRARNDLYMQAARPLAAGTIRKALSAAGLAPADIDHFIVISCTGFDTPGLDVILAGDLEMRPNLRRSALIGMGCFAGLTGIDRGLLELAARPSNHALVLAVEFGTLHFQHGKELENMVAGAIFGDGLAAAILGPGPTGPGMPHIVNTMTYSDYSTQELMGVRLTDNGFQINLSTRVPKLLGSIVPELVTDFLSQSELTPADIDFWGIHPGGARILDYVEQALDLMAEDLRFSRQVLRRYGNMSSATTFFVLDEIIQCGHPQPGQYALQLAFGPGLTIELCLLRW